ncbi:TetR/AcrR family transcriptional regulator [Streptomyces sp. NBC_01451]|uniref:TetR/AcrR family transcriptional regulator n=1 Tax=Streptomyces sp. NBC_01451 TaxID=2903872 RepID=UPI002E319DA9|nr:TetR/AcrR family transcriptional regulator [Streptomyces sp. NBC_01451]
MTAGAAARAGAEAGLRLTPEGCLRWWPGPAAAGRCSRPVCGTGTLFLYAKTKGELLLLVQNAKYVEALERGRADAESVPGVLDAVMAIVRPIVECNRVQIDNGRTYLREMVFGDPEEPRHGAALAVVAQTEEAMAAALRRDERVTEGDAVTLAHIVSAVTFLSMAVSVNMALSVEEIVRDIRRQVDVLLPD